MHHLEKWYQSTKTATRPTPIRKQQKLGYELQVEGETQSQASDRGIRNQEKRVQWERQCVQLHNLGPAVDGIPWEEADIKVRSYIYLSLGKEGHFRLCQHYPDFAESVNTTPTRKSKIPLFETTGQDYTTYSSRVAMNLRLVGGVHKKTVQNRKN